MCKPVKRKSNLVMTRYLSEAFQRHEYRALKQSKISLTGSIDTHITGMSETLAKIVEALPMSVAYMEDGTYITQAVSESDALC